MDEVKDCDDCLHRDDPWWMEPCDSCCGAKEWEPKMTIQEAIEHGKEQLDVFGGVHREFIEMAIEALEMRQKREKTHDTTTGSN